MVVAYRCNPVTAFVLRTLGLVKVRYFSLPNLLAGRALVPEFLQEQVQGAALGGRLLEQLEEPGRVRELQQEFTAIHRALRLRRRGARGGRHSRLSRNRLRRRAQPCARPRGVICPRRRRR